MRPCSITYVIFEALVNIAISLYKAVAVGWRQCSRAPCWWFLCLNRLGCWIGLIIVTILITVFLVVMVLIGAAVVTFCWGTCLLIFVFSGGGNFNQANLDCFGADPTPPTPEPLPTVIITRPAAGTPAGYYLPTDVITFTAIGEDVDGSPLTGSSLQWFDTYSGANDQPLGEGETISTTLVLRPEDAQAGRVTDHLVSVVATGSDGRKSAPGRRSAFIRQGLT